MTRRIVYVAYGKRAITEAGTSIDTLQRHNRTNVSIICNENIKVGGAQVIAYDNPGAGSRWAKLNLDLLVEADIIGYLDADTRIHGDLSPAFEIIESGWDMALVASANQGYNIFNHIGIEERGTTLAELNAHPLQYQCGVMFFNRHSCRELFAEWRRQWLRWQGQDQAAFTRALYANPVKVWLLGPDWNSQSGQIVTHLFGRAR